ncbi:GGDEF domain-containing protein [Aureimonas psammosilenae]|uniref:GGDEF domain-containing protein n=1 Tax=Aureimonas psammosilenae TaxID=2495496 RepID=UPI00186A4DD8|nr:GGDEF domain-containing protein [Aureimonas psammosilenae]
MSIVFSSAMFWHQGSALLARGVVSGVLLSVLIGAPHLGYLSYHLVKLSIANRDLERAANEDSLTGLLNRGSFSASVEMRLEAMRDCPITRGAFLVIDADNFKQINDRWGHAVGDKALATMAAEMKRSIQRCDLVARLGGEEFGLFLEGASRSRSLLIAEQVRAHICALELRSEEGERVPLSVSIGGVHFCEVQSFATLYRIADAKLYEAKANGRNRVEFEEMHPEVRFVAAA